MNDFSQQPVYAHIAQSSRESANRIARADPDSKLGISPSRSGRSVPFIHTETGQRLLHSRFDPMREGERLAAEVPSSGCIVALGLGGAYHLTPLLAREELCSLIIIDFGAGLLRSILEEIELTKLFSDPRVRLLVDPSEAEIDAAVRAEYRPLFDKAAVLFPLRPRVELEAEAFSSALTSARSAIDDNLSDLATQERFGKRWLHHSLLNLSRWHEQDVRRAAEAWQGLGRKLEAARVRILAAGPSLEIDAGGTEDGATDDRRLLATDSALPFLRARRIRPHAVVSIDCQLAGYHHLFSPPDSQTVAVVDLAVLPLYPRRCPQTVYFASGHPLSQLARAFFGTELLPNLDTGGRNVTQTALSLAESSGASEAELCGADFAYPDRKPYARGTYLPRHAHARSNRLEPCETRLATHAIDRSGAGGTRPLLDSYLREALRFAQRSALRVTMGAHAARRSEWEAKVPLGASVKQEADKRGQSDPAARRWGAEEAGSGRDFLLWYRKELGKLDLSQADAPHLDRRRIEALPAEERLLAYSLLPYSAFLNRRGGEGGRGYQNLTLVRELTLSYLDRILGSEA